MSKEFKEWYKVIEIAELLGLSKVSVYNKLKTLNSETLQSLQRKEKGITYYNYKIISLLKDGANLNSPPVVNEEKEVAAAADPEPLNDYKDEYIQSLNDQIIFLRQQVTFLNDRLAHEQELHMNTQILFKQQQKPDIKMLEAHFKELDTKIEIVRQQMQIRQTKSNPSKLNIFKKIFKR